MYTNIIVALSLEHGISEKALAAARVLLTDGGTITAVHVYEPPNSSVMAFLEDDAEKKAREKAMAELSERVQGHDDVTPVLLKSPSAGGEITEYARTHGTDCIVMASHKPGMKDFFLGSTAARVVRHAGCAVHVMRV
ncbi:MULTISPECIES: universal stress protein [Rhodobacterales]|uniref:Universal stress protein n=1 Tax=Halocynthiibacter styelae TaxID=2761955 RepID=A0A8J7J550_9RHOB|nr:MULTISPECIES: universal stress protein [Rhodobacterales]MBI1493545.1 universal stress protein [Paenihalocynthiibacter styelae]